jgi:hypothetical protein
MSFLNPIVIHEAVFQMRAQLLVEADQFHRHAWDSPVQERRGVLSHIRRLVTRARCECERLADPHPVRSIRSGGRTVTSLASGAALK